MPFVFQSLVVLYSQNRAESQGIQVVEGMWFGGKPYFVNWKGLGWCAGLGVYSADPGHHLPKQAQRDLQESQD